MELDLEGTALSPNLFSRKALNPSWLVPIRYIKLVIILRNIFHKTNFHESLVLKNVKLFFILACPKIRNFYFLKRLILKLNC